MQSAANKANSGNHQRSPPRANIPQKIAKAPKAEKFSGKGAKRRANVSPSKRTISIKRRPGVRIAVGLAARLDEVGLDKRESARKGVGMTSNLRNVSGWMI
jgi:hypothetical protein